MGGLAFLWVTSRRDILSAGYRWLLYAVWGSLAGLSSGIGFAGESVLLRDIAGALVAGIAIAAVVLSLSKSIKFTPKQLDIWAPLVGLVGLVAAAISAEEMSAENTALAVARVIIGALFLGAVTDTMLLGHWYLVQPGMSRAPLKELVIWAGVLWLADAIIWIVPRGIFSASGEDGILAWFWLVCAIATAGLLATTHLSLKEPRYSAVMAATGLSYLAVMTAVAMELVARAVVF